LSFHLSLVSYSSEQTLDVLQVFAGMVYILAASYADSGTPLWQASLDQIPFLAYQGDTFLYAHINGGTLCSH